MSEVVSVIPVRLEKRALGPEQVERGGGAERSGSWPAFVAMLRVVTALAFVRAEHWNGTSPIVNRYRT